MTDDELRNKLRTFLEKRPDLGGAKGWSRKAGLSERTLGEFLNPFRRQNASLRFASLDALAVAAGVTIFELLGRGPRPPSSMAAIHWLKLVREYGANALVEADSAAPPVFLPRTLIEQHAFGDPARVLVHKVCESLDALVRPGDLAAFDRLRIHPSRESGHYLVYDGSAVAARALAPIGAGRLRVMAESGAFDIGGEELKIIGRIFWRGGSIS